METNKEMTKTEILRSEYAKIRSIDPEGETYKKICEFLDARTDKELRDFVAAKIKFISALANNRLIQRNAV